MLVLSRKAGERIAIGDGITVMVLGVSRGRVRIGIEAPVYVKVRRGASGHSAPAAGEAAEICARQGELVTLNKMAGQNVASDRQSEQVVGRW